MAEPQAAPATPSVANPAILIKQLREQYPELDHLDDKTLLSESLSRHPEWRGGVPKDARKQTIKVKPLGDVTGATKATGISGPRTWGESFRENLPTIGMAAGGLMGGPPGAAIGGAVGEGARLLTRQAQNLPIPETYAGQVGSVAEEAAIGAGTEYVGGQLAKPIKKMATGIYREAMTDPEAQLARTASEKYGLKITAPELAGKPEALSLKAAASGYLKIGPRMIDEAQLEARKKTVTAIESSLQKLDSQLLHSGGTVYTPEEAGSATKQGLQLAHQVFQHEDNALYRSVDYELQKLVTVKQVTKPVTSSMIDPTTGKPAVRQATSFVKEGLQVSMKPLRQYMTRQLRSIQEIAPTLHGLAGQDKSLLSFANAIEQLPDSVSFENANALRGNLLAELRKINDLLPGKFKGLEKTITKLLDRQMEVSATKGGGPVLNAWREANQFHATGARIFQDSLVADLTVKTLNSENVFKKLGADQVTDAKAVMEGFTRYAQYATPAEKVAINRTRDVFRQGYLSGMLKDSLATLTTGGRVDLKGILAKHKPVLDVILTGDPKVQAVRQDFAQLAAFLDRQAPAKGLSHWALFEALAGAGTLVWGSHGSSVEVLGAAEAAPWIITKILYNPTATRFLMDGIKAQGKAWPITKTLAKGARVTLDKASQPGMANLMRAIRIALTPSEQEETPPSPGGGGQ